MTEAVIYLAKILMPITKVLMSLLAKKCKNVSTGC